MSGKIIEYSDGIERVLSISLAEAKLEWKVKLVKKTKSAELSNYSGNSPIVVVPAYIDNYPVKKIGVFSNNPESIEEVIIPPFVESLTDKTFKGCKNLSKLTINKKTAIPFGAFTKCNKLTDENGCIVVGGILLYMTPHDNVIISDGVTKIPDGFEDRWQSGSGKIKSIVFPDSLEIIGENAFTNHPKLSELVFPPNLKEIGSDSFRRCNGLTKIVFNEGLKKLHGFRWCETYSYLDIKVPDTVNDFNAFEFSFINRIQLSAGLTEIPERCFYGCRELEEIRIPEGIKKIGDSAFGACSNLKDVYIPDSVQVIGKKAFENCSEAKFHYNEHPMTLPADAFLGCDGLADDNGFQIFNNTLIRYKGSAQYVEIPASITKIGNYAFKNNESIQSITINNPDIQIGDVPWLETFKGCKGLADADGFVIVNNYLFDYVGSSREIEIPEGVEYIASNCFSPDNVSHVIIPPSVKNMGAGAFFGKEIEIEFRESVPFISNQWMIATEYRDYRVEDYGDETVYTFVGKASSEKDRKEMMEDEYYVIGDCLVDCGNTDSLLKIPDGIKSIARFAMRYIDHEAVYLPEGLEYIAPGALGETKVLYLPKSIKRIDSLPSEDITVYVHEGIDFDSVLVDKTNANYTIKIIGKND